MKSVEKQARLITSTSFQTHDSLYTYLHRIVESHPVSLSRCAYVRFGASYTQVSSVRLASYDGIEVDDSCNTLLAVCRVFGFDNPHSDVPIWPTPNGLVPFNQGTGGDVVVAFD